jgi:hypothetical protein
MIKVYFRIGSFERHEFSNLWNQEEKIFVIDFIKGWFSSKERIVERKIEKGELINPESGMPYNGHYRKITFKCKLLRLNYFSHNNSFYNEYVHTARMSL